MDEFTSTKTYLREHTGIPVLIKSIGKKEWKGVESFTVTFQRERDGALIDAKFKLPMNQITQKQYQKLLAAAGVKESKELVNKKVSIQINMTEYEGKKYWNPSSFSPVHYSNEYNDPEAGTGNESKEESFEF